MTTFVVILVLLLFLAAILLLRTVQFTRREELPLLDIEPAAVDRESLARHLAQMIRCRTISLGEQEAVNTAAFDELHALLEKTYPRLHGALKREKVNHCSLLYTWQGSQPELPGLLLTAHLDVVPAEEDSQSEWEHEPFSGDIDEQFVWGRGALDIKNQVTALLECVEQMLAGGYCPRRTIYLAFGHDEEIGGFHGAAAIAALLQERGVRLAAVLDEGGAIYQEVLPGVKLPVAMLGVAEKGYLSLELQVEAAPGHSSMPPAHTAIGVLSRAITRLEKSPLPVDVNAVRPMFKGVGLAAPFLLQMVMANLWLFGPLVAMLLQRQPQTNAIIRTTTAVTMISGGVKDNVLPDRARAVVNFRILPGNSIASVCEWVRKCIRDGRVSFSPLPDCAWEPSPVSPFDTRAVMLLKSALQQVFGPLPVAPFWVLGGTDARHYSAICERVYRFSPVLMGKEDMSRVHGINERIGIEALAQMVQFYDVLLRAWDASEEAL